MSIKTKTKDKGEKNYDKTLHWNHYQWSRLHT